MVLSYKQLVELVDQGILDGVDPKNINGSTIDITLADVLRIEGVPDFLCPNCGDTDILLAPPLRRHRARHSDATCPNCGWSGLSFEAFRPVDLAEKEKPNMIEVSCSGDGYVLYPGNVCLGSTQEFWNLPLDISSEYKLKSSMARAFLEHLNAGWADPGFHGSNLTLELVNLNQYHPIRLRAGMKIGQIIFYRHVEVPHKHSYKVRGQYNNSLGVTESKGLR